MHYTISYKNDEDALVDVMSYWGKERFEEIYRSIIDYYRDVEDSQDECVHFNLSFAGVEGYPVKALIRKAKHELGLLCYWPNPKEYQK